jgi:arylsulfatase A-like enzyme
MVNESSLARIGARELMTAAVLIGILAGIAEAGVAVWRRNVKHFPTGYFVNAEVYWMTPLAAVLTFLAGGLALMALDRAIRGRGVLPGLGPPVFAGVALFSLIRSLTIGIGYLPALLLSVGAATAVARLMSSRPGLFRSAVRPAAIMAVSLIVFAAALPVARKAALARAYAALPEPVPGTPNVLIVIWDAVRAMNLSLHDYDRQTTPVLDSLARNSAVFERAFATSPWSLPSHASMFTGRYPTELTAARQAPLDDTYPTLAEALAGHGYATGGFTANIHYGSASYGIARGFTKYVDVAPIRPGVIASTWWPTRRARRLLQNRIARHAPGPLRPHAVDVNRAFLGWIDGRGSRPFFAVLNQFEAHDPYLPPRPFNLAFSDVQPRFWVPGDGTVYSERQLQELVTAYDGSIRYLDHELGRLLDALRLRGVLDNTVVIVTSDHGEQFGEHGRDLVKHSNSLYSPVLHVPLVVIAPALVPAGRHAHPVSIRDIPATVMHVTGLADTIGFPGTSLLRYADGSVTAAEIAEPRLSAGEKSGLEVLMPHWPIAAGDMFSLLAGDLHYIMNGDGREELYDVATDPMEQRDLAGLPDMERELVRLRAALDSVVPLHEGVRRAFVQR